MKAIICTQAGEPNDVLNIIEMPVPEVGEYGVLVKMHTAAIQPRDLDTVHGVHQVFQKFPATPGLEGFGQVISIGAQVHGLKAGDWVIRTCPLTDQWSNGTWQEYVCWDESEVYPVPAGIEPKFAAQLFSLLPAYILTVLDLNLGPNRVVMVTDGASVLGKTILQFAKLYGFSVISVVDKADQVDELKRLGAKEVICSATDDVAKKALAYTSLKGLDAIIDSSSGNMTSKCVSTLAIGGRMRILSALSENTNAEIDMRKLLFSQLEIKGFNIMDWWHASTVHERSMTMQKMIQLVESRSLEPSSGQIFSMTEFKAAIGQKRPGPEQGRAFLTF